LPSGPLAAPRGVYLPPPWMRALVLDPATLQPANPGDAGLAAFVDLANVDSAVFVVTQDMARLESGGLRLLGRRPRAPLRGCSLAAEAAWASQASHRRSRHAERCPAALEVASRASTTDEQALDRVRHLVEGARRLADPADELGQRARARLLETTGL